MKKKNILLAISLGLGLAYLVYSFIYFADVGSSSDGGALASVLVMPHMVMVFLAVVFNGLAFALNKKGFALTAGILYAVSIIFMPIYFMFVIIQMVLCFVAFAKIGKKVKVPTQRKELVKEDMPTINNKPIKDIKPDNTIKDDKGLEIIVNVLIVLSVVMIAVAVIVVIVAI